MPVFVNALDAEAGVPNAADGAASGGVPAVSRCLSILRYLDQGPPGGAGLSEIATALRITKSHCLNILRTLVEEGWVSHDPQGRRYRLAGGLLEDFRSLLGRDGRTARLRDELLELTARTGCPGILTRIDDDGSFVVVVKVETDEVPTAGPVGYRYPWDAPAQLRARLAWSDPETIRQFLHRRRTAYTERTLTGRRRLLVELEQTRARGYAKAHGEFVPSLVSYAVPLLDVFGTVRAILQCPTLQDGIEARESTLVESLLKARSRMQLLI